MWDPHVCTALAQTMGKPKGAQLSAFEVGQIKAHAQHGWGPVKIAAAIRKPNGDEITHGAVSKVLKKLTKQKQWKGERKPGSGRRRKTSKAFDKAIVREVFKSRGKRKVTVPYLRKKFPAARKVGNTCLEERLHEAGLQWLRRRRKTVLTGDDLTARCSWADWV